MSWGRRVPLPWLVIGAVILCAWCSMASGIAGWLMGHDFAQREASVAFATAVAGGSALPPLGVLVTRLDRTGPAYLAGIERGDIIVAINGTHVQDARDLRDQLSAYHPRDQVRLKILRDENTHDIVVPLDPFPNELARPYLGIYYTARAEEPADL